MQQNLKVDIIYYDTPTDFELEFNLCGCCRMRLLTNKTDDQKVLLHMLARSVSRSRIILIFGKLFGKNSAINLVAQSIGKSLETVDNSLYNIDSKDEIGIIEGSLPLVTDDGYFGGCIIESGPQTIIVLSDNKNVRKSIMTTLIHPYIEQTSQIELTGEEKETITVIEEAKTETETEVETEAETEGVVLEDVAEESANTIPEDASENEQNSNEEPLDQSEDFEEEPELPEESEQSDAIGFVFDEEESDEDSKKNNTSIPGLYVEIDEENSEYRPDKYFSDTVYNEETIKDFLFDSNNERDSFKKSNIFTFNKIILAFIILLLVLIGIVCFCLFYIPISQGYTPTELLETIFRTLFSKGG